MHRRRTWLLTASGLAIAAGLAWGWHRSRVPLIDRATDVGIAPAPALMMQPLPDGTLIGTRYLQGPGPPRAKPVRFDPRTGVETPLAGLAAKLQAAGSPHMQFSPDGRWALWQTTAGLHVTSLDGTDDRVWPLAKPRSAVITCWQQDSQGWAARWFPLAGSPGTVAGASTRLTLGRIDAPGKTREAVTPPLPPMTSIAGFLPDGRALLINDRAPGSGGPQVFTLDLAQPKPVLAPYHFTVPAARGKDKFASLMLISPRGDRILCAATQEVRQGPVTVWVRRLLGGDQQGGRSIATVWITRLDGSDAHEVLTADQDDRTLSLCGWTLDGRGLLIGRGGRLLRVDVP